MSRPIISVVGFLVLLTLTVVESRITNKHRRSYEPILHVELASEQCARRGYAKLCSAASTNNDVCNGLFCAGEDLIAKSVGRPLDGTNCRRAGMTCYMGRCIETIRMPSNKPEFEAGEKCTFIATAAI